MRLYEVTLPKTWTVRVRHHNARQARRLAIRAKGTDRLDCRSALHPGGRERAERARRRAGGAAWLSPR